MHCSIRKRAWKTADGDEREAWLVSYQDNAGKRRSKQFAKKKDADAYRVTVEGQLRNGTHVAETLSCTVADACKRFIRGRELADLENSTIRQYRSHIEHHIEPLMGNMKLTKLTMPMVEAFKENLLETRTKITARYALRTFRMMLTDAQRRGLVAQNVATGVTVDVPKRERKQIVIPTKTEVKEMLDAASGRWRPFFVTAVFTGMRASELRGLVWDAVDFDTGVINVIQRADEVGVLGPCKSQSGYREIPMTPMVKNTLKEWKLQCPSSKKNLVFPTRNGQPHRLSNVHNRCIKAVQKRANVVDENGRPKFSLHDFRHWYASWLIDQGFNMKRVQVLMGHSSITVTMDVYAHLLKDDDISEKLAAGELALVGH
jgi:integrase